MSEPQPAIYLPHGGGPWTIADLGFDMKPLATYLRGLATLTPKPKAFLVISAHWEEKVPTVMTSAAPPMLYDYSGFPPETYEFTWAPPGAPDVAARVQELLGAAGIDTATDAKRGIDHGVYVPLMLPFPDAEVPTLQLSLKEGLDAKEHLAMGKALAPLRDEGVLILGSGMSYHNLPMVQRSFRHPKARREVQEQSEIFDAWLGRTMGLAPQARASRLAEWTGAPSAAEAHPRAEHLMPLMVVTGAAFSAKATTPFHEMVLNAIVRAIHLG